MLHYTVHIKHIPQLSALNAHVNRAMQLKFGQIVDLEKLEVLQSNPAIEEKKDQLRAMDKQARREVNEIQEKIEEKKRELVSAVRANTQRLNRIYSLISVKNGIEERLDARQKTMVSQ